MKYLKKIAGKVRKTALAGLSALVLASPINCSEATVNNNINVGGNDGTDSNTDILQDCDELCNYLSDCGAIPYRGWWGGSLREEVPDDGSMNCAIDCRNHKADYDPFIDCVAQQECYYGIVEICEETLPKAVANPDPITRPPFDSEYNSCAQIAGQLSMCRFIGDGYWATKEAFIIDCEYFDLLNLEPYVTCLSREDCDSSCIQETGRDFSRLASQHSR